MVLGSGYTFQGEGPDFSVYDMVNEVNTIRIAQGLAPLQINATLMAVAQAHSDYQAAMQRSSHAGRSGEIVNARVAAAGYGSGNKIVAGENVANLDLGITDMLQIIVYEIWSDAGHRGAMINPKYQDIGVGIASDGKMFYVTLNLAGVVSDNSSNLVQPSDPTIVSQSDADSPGKPVIQPLFTSTPQADGSVYHVVGYGQTLMTIARIYEVAINDLVNINKINPDKIYAGQKLWIKKIMLPTVTSTLTAYDNFNLPTNPHPSAIVIHNINHNPESKTAPTTINSRKTGMLVIFGLLILVLVFFLFTGESDDPGLRENDRTVFKETYNRVQFVHQIFFLLRDFHDKKLILVQAISVPEKHH